MADPQKRSGKSTGWVAARLSNANAEALGPQRASNLAGPLFETFVMGELRRALGWAQGSVSLFHFRTRDGIEVDIVCEDDNRNVAGIEVKASASITLSDFRGLTLLRDKLGNRFTLGVVLYPGNTALPFGDRLMALPLEAMWS